MKDLDFEDPRHPFSQRKILFKKGIELAEAGYYLIEISQTKLHIFIVAHDFQNQTNFGQKYFKKLPIAQGI